MSDDVEQLSTWNWKAPLVAWALGAIQISAGVVLQTLCRIPGVGILLIRQGSGDIMFAVRTGVANSFIWSEYFIQKLISLPFTVVSITVMRWLFGSAENAAFCRSVEAKVVAKRVAMVLARGVATVCFGKVLMKAKVAVLEKLRGKFEETTENVFAQIFVDLEKCVENIFRLNPTDAESLISEAFDRVVSRFDKEDANISDRFRSAAVEFLPTILVELGLEFLSRRTGEDIGDRTLDSVKFATLSAISVAECGVFARNFLTSLKETLQETINVINVFFTLHAFSAFFINTRFQLILKFLKLNTCHEL